MPLHDWTRGDDSLFHDFHHSWVCALAARLNGGVLPSSHFAMIETIELRPEAGFTQLNEPEQPYKDPGRLGAIREVETDPPSARFVATDERRQYASKAITVRHADHFQPVAAILWVTRQDKQTPYRFRAVVRTAVGAITHRIHLLIVDLFPPTVGDPQGIHKAIWDEFKEQPFDFLHEKPLTIASYVAGDELTAYVEPVAVGDPLPSPPIFLSNYEYVPAPLEATYSQAWTDFPDLLKELIEPA